MFEQFETGVSKKIHKANDLLQLASDGHNITLLFLKLYEEKRCLIELPGPLDITVCGLHNIHRSLKNSEKQVNGKFKKFLGLKDSLA